MRRGFKSWCERVAAEYRRSLGLGLTEALDPRALAVELNVRVLTPEDLPHLPHSSLKQLTETGSDSWSAVTIFQSGIRLVILNSGHSLSRQTNSLSHELAHLILNHRSDDAEISLEGVLFRSSFDKEQEEEADWLAACLLVPREGLLQLFWRTKSPRILAERFGVSPALIKWRLRMTGVTRQVAHAATVRRRTAKRMR